MYISIWLEKSYNYVHFTNIFFFRFKSEIFQTQRLPCFVWKDATLASWCWKWRGKFAVPLQEVSQWIWTQKLPRLPLPQSRWTIFKIITYLKLPIWIKSHVLLTSSMFMRMKFGLLNPSAELMVKVLIRNTQNTDIMIVFDHTTKMATQEN